MSRGAFHPRISRARRVQRAQHSRRDRSAPRQRSWWWPPMGCGRWWAARWVLSSCTSAHSAAQAGAAGWHCRACLASSRSSTVLLARSSTCRLERGACSCNLRSTPGLAASVLNTQLPAVPAPPCAGGRGACGRCWQPSRGRCAPAAHGRGALGAALWRPHPGRHHSGSGLPLTLSACGGTSSPPPQVRGSGAPLPAATLAIYNTRVQWKRMNGSRGSRVAPPSSRAAWPLRAHACLSPYFCCVALHSPAALAPPLLLPTGPGWARDLPLVFEHHF